MAERKQIEVLAGVMGWRFTKGTYGDIANLSQQAIAGDLEQTTLVYVERYGGGYSLGLVRNRIGAIQWWQPYEDMDDAWILVERIRELDEAAREAFEGYFIYRQLHSPLDYNAPTICEAVEALVASGEIEVK